MRLAVMLAVALLAGCGAKDDAEAGAESTAGGEGANLPAGIGVEDPARLQQRVDAAMAAILPKPAEARYAEVRSGVAGAICGQVDAVQSDGKYAGLRPFVVTPQGVAIISITAQIPFDGPVDEFPDYYLRWCASPEELAAIGSRVEVDASDMPPPPSADLLPDVPADLDVPVTVPPPLPPAPMPPDTRWGAPVKIKAPPRTNADDSFYNVVVREDGSGK